MLKCQRKMKVWRLRRHPGGKPQQIRSLSVALINQSAVLLNKLSPGHQGALPLLRLIFPLLTKQKTEKSIALKSNNWKII
jgi:hypothetical protein